MSIKTQVGLEKWESIDYWQLWLPPSRPSAEHIAFYRRHIESLSGPRRIAVLGSTPEIRDLCAEITQNEVHVLELNKNFHERMNGLRIYPDSKEVFHHGDWLTLLPAFKGTFDVIVSDTTLINIPYEDHEAFLAAVHDALTPNGIFIDKVLTSGRLPLHDLDTLDKKYLSAPFNYRTVYEFMIDYFFTSKALVGEIVSVRTIESLLIKRFSLLSEHASVRLLRLLDAAVKLLPENGYWWHGRPWGIKDHQSALQLDLIDEEWEPDSSLWATRMFIAAFRNH